MQKLAAHCEVGPPMRIRSPLLGYYFKIAIGSLRRNPFLTALIVLGIGLGVGAFMTTLSVLYVMGSDPIPWKSHRLHLVQIDNWDALDAYNSTGDPPNLLAYRDAAALLNAGRADKQTAMYRFTLPIQPSNPEIRAYNASGRATTSDFFGMFDPPIKFGSAWSRGMDDQHARVVVLDAKTNEKIFGGGDSVGKTLRMDNSEFTVVGVLDEWSPNVKYYALGSGKLARPESLYIPFSTAIERKIGFSKAFGERLLASEDTNFDFWVELDSDQKREDYRAFLDAYVEDQKKLGRLQRPLNNRLYDVLEVMHNRHVLPQDIEAQAGLSLTFLVICLVNAIGLMMAKFNRKSGEIGVRRALGASRRDIFLQHLVEASVVGLSGGVFGLVLTGAGLWLIRMLEGDYSNVARINLPVAVATIVVAVAASILAGLYPTWRASCVEPAIQVRSQ